ncbi:MFS transporter [Streptomyces malaysiensis]|uniref:hypothetical protein n=1 Tax=Streptomyces sp. HNM0561 TaxID=2903099 RepID=UPI003FA68B29
MARPRHGGGALARRAQPPPRGHHPRPTARGGPGRPRDERHRRRSAHLRAPGVLRALRFHRAPAGPALGAGRRRVRRARRHCRRSAAAPLRRRDRGLPGGQRAGPGRDRGEQRPDAGDRQALVPGPGRRDDRAVLDGPVAGHGRRRRGHRADDRRAGRLLAGRARGVGAARRRGAGALAVPRPRPYERRGEWPGGERPGGERPGGERSGGERSGGERGANGPVASASVASASDAGGSETGGGTGTRTGTDTDTGAPAAVAETAAAPADGPAIRIARSPLAWAMAVFFGFQATAAYISMGWMPQIFRDAGVSASTSGLLLAVMMAMGVPLAFVLPRIAARLRHQGVLVVILGVLGLIGYGGLWLAPAEGAWLWALLLGVANCAFPLALTMIGMRTRTHAGVVRLSAFAQSVGYLLSIPGPLLVGVLYQHSGGWGQPLALMAGFMVPQIVAGVLAGRDRTLEDEG